MNEATAFSILSIILGAIIGHLWWKNSQQKKTIRELQKRLIQHLPIIPDFLIKEIGKATLEKTKDGWEINIPHKPYGAEPELQESIDRLDKLLKEKLEEELAKISKPKSATDDSASGSCHGMPKKEDPK